ncbi:uncharacterized protein LOC108479441 [Gossypium arboreum]|uniref:uncharacterized protein LOC108479441 n=1 Tax=Gossypium arboreum TaxID=29729 RepID=UPI0008192233|nr:uncharacterized protein LOC108479441 [Gossypium arboreum]
MDKRLKKLEQIQKDMQEQMQSQMQEQLAKIQQEMKEQMMESQREMMSQLSQLLMGRVDKGKGPMDNVGENNEDPQYPPGFTPTHVQTQPEINLQKPSVMIRLQQFQAGVSIPMNFQASSSYNPANNSNNPMVPDLDEVAKEERAKVELQKQLEERCKWLEEKVRPIEGVNRHPGIDAKDLSLVLDLVLPYKFKMPKCEKYNGTSCPKAHITMFCRTMTGYVHNDQLLIHCLQDSLVGVAAKWYNQLSRNRISSWRDLAQAFMKQYSHVTDITSDRITLQNMEKKPNESFKQYAQRWREMAIQVQPPLLEKETTMLFINTLKAPFITHMLGSATRSFADVVMIGEMIENAIRNGRIDARESAKRFVPQKKENEVNNANKGYSKSVTISQPKAVTAGQGSSRQESGTRQNNEKIQFTPIPMMYKELFQSLFDAHVVASFYLKPFQPPFPKWYDANAQCSIT